jgi:stearoyl-CoA desaturase (delta-9 desaturase)
MATLDPLPSAKSSALALQLSTLAKTKQAQRHKQSLPPYDPSSDLSDSDNDGHPTGGVRKLGRLGGAKRKNPTWGEDEETAVDDDNYLERTLRREKPLPPITWRTFHKEINVVSTIALTLVPALALYGALTTPLLRQTLIWAVVYYYFTGLGITAGYHRLWAHRCYNASLPLQYFLALGGSGAVQGSIRWWSRGHRAHHRYTDTDLDPYSAHKGLLWSHIGWMIVKPRRSPGVADVSDLSRNTVVRWQHRWYLPLLFSMGFLFPTLVAGLCWDDWRGGFFYAGAARLLFVHQSTFCVNSLAHWLGEAPFDDKHTPRDHVITAFVTIGEGYHNFHHQFPQDFRNAIKWYQYDPTKWFISLCASLGLASNLKTFPDNEVRKGQYNMKLKELQHGFKDVSWPKDSNDLPILSWEQFQEQAKESGRSLVVVGGFIHDVTDFMDEHPGGRGLIKAKLGKDASVAFHGGVYDHSNAAHNLLAMFRVGVIEGGYEVEHLKKKVGVFQEPMNVPVCGPKKTAASPASDDIVKPALAPAVGPVTAIVV